MTVSSTLYPVKWVRLKKYCELTGDTPDAIHARRRKGEWINDVQCRLAPDRHVWVNLCEVEKWIEKQRTTHVVNCPKLHRV